jgi:putative transposase
MMVSSSCFGRFISDGSSPREERLTVRRRGGRKRALGTRAPMALPQGPDQRWSLDFVSDMLADGRRFRVLVIVDDFTREWLALIVDTSICGRRVARELDTIIATRKKPLMAVSDNGTELTSHAILRWQQERVVGWHYIARPSRSRTLLSRASIAAFAMNAATRTCSGACRWHGGSLSMAARLQCLPPPYQPRRSGPERVCSPVPTGPQQNGCWL